MSVFVRPLLAVSLCFAAGCPDDPITRGADGGIDVGFATQGDVATKPDTGPAPGDASGDALGDVVPGDGPTDTADVADVPAPDVSTPDVPAGDLPITPDAGADLPSKDGAPSDVAPDVAPDVLPVNPCLMDDGTDTDGDGLSDCHELEDAFVSTDKFAFNGLTATIGEPPTGFFTSAQCDLFFGNSYGEMFGLFDQSNQVMDVYAGWDYAASSNDYDSADFGFQPNWSHSDNGGVWASFQILFTGQVWLEQAGTHCFSVDTGSGGFAPGDIAGRRNACGRVYINATSASQPLAETGYGAAASPVTGCLQMTAGWHTIDIAARHYETYSYAPQLQVRHCVGGPDGCTPDEPLNRRFLRAAGAEGCTPDCDGAACGPDDCGGDCGSCVGDATCDAAGQCATCTPACDGKTCGLDGCGGSCGECPDDGSVCTAGTCKACEPVCSGKVCGLDGCGGSCGTCPGADDTCDADGQCVAPAAGACTNAADQGIINGLGEAGLTAAITECGTPCVLGGAANKEQCVTDCIISDIGISPACAACYGGVTGCAIDNCTFQCITQGATCDACMASNGCADDYPACSGLEY